MERLILGDNVEDKKIVHPSAFRVIEKESGLNIGSNMKIYYANVYYY